jgi:hypothetical protein
MNNAVANPFGSKTSAIVETAGARQSQSRELAEMQTKYLMAQRFPNNHPQHGCLTGRRR